MLGMAFTYPTGARRLEHGQVTLPPAPLSGRPLDVQAV